jgi:hypothetical protein
MDLQLDQRRPPRGPFSVLHWLFVRLLIAAVILVLGYFGYRYVLTDQLDEQIRQKIQAKFQDHYSDLVVSVEAARRIEGEGIEIRGLSIREPGQGKEPPLVYVEQINTRCNVDLQELLTAEPVVSKVTVRRAHLHVVRREDGSWNVSRLFPPPKFGERSPPIAFEECSAQFFDAAHPDRDPPQWRDVQLTLTPDAAAATSLGLSPDEAPCAISIAGRMTGDHFSEVRLEGNADVKSGRWSIRGEISQLQFTPAMREKLPSDFAAELAPIAAVSGNTHLRFEADNLTGPSEPVQFRVAGEISEGRIDDDRLPLPLTDLSASLFADNAGLKIEDLKARLGAATIELSVHVEGYDSASPMSLYLAAEQLAIDDRLAQSLPSDALRLWNQLSPNGLASGKLWLDFDGRSWQPRLDAKLEQMTFIYDKFQYPMSDGQATLKLQNDLLTLKGTARAGNSPVQFEAEVYNAGPNWYGFLEARSQEPLPIDERLIGALTPTARDVVQSFSPRGSVQLTGRWDRRKGATRPPHSDLEVTLCDCSVAYRLFRYPIDHVTGTLRSSDGVWSFVNLRGSQGATQIQASGGFGPDGMRGNLLTMDFRCQDVSLDETLRKALPPDHQKLWGDIRPRGELDVLNANLSYRPGEKKFALEIDAQQLLRKDEKTQRTIRIEPVWFPYSMDISSGLVGYRDGVVQLSKLDGTHGKTKLKADGRCNWSPLEWSFQLDRLTADRLQLDHELLAALPGDAGRALAKAKFSGSLDMTGELKFAGRKGQPSADATWDLSFDIEDGSIAGETPAEQIKGDLRVAGGSEAGRWFSRGDVKFDSLFVRDVQVTRVIGPFYLDSKQLLLGSWAARDVKGVPPQLTAQVFDGLLTTDAMISLEDDGKFTLETKLDQASLAKIAQETGSTAPDISGKTFGVLQMTGTTRGKHTWKGGGNVRLRDAYLARVPFAIALLKPLSVRSADDSAFTTSDIDFHVEGDDVTLDRFDLAGDAISLKGRGRLKEQKQIDVMFYTQVGRRDLQVLRPLMAGASPSFLLIEVTGTIDSPSVKKTAFPVLNETLRELFPDLARGDGPAASAARIEPRTLLPRSDILWRK